MSPSITRDRYPFEWVCVCVCERARESERERQKRENLASSYRWWHLNRPKEESADFECHMKGLGGMGYLGIPSFLWQPTCIQMGSYVRNLLFLALSLFFSFALLCLCVVPLCLSEARRAVLLGFDALTLPCHWGVRSLVGQEWWHKEGHCSVCACVCVFVCVCVFQVWGVYHIKPIWGRTSEPTQCCMTGQHTHTQTHMHTH